MIAVVVTADNVELALLMVKDQLKEAGYLHMRVDWVDLVPLPTHHRYARTVYNAEDGQL